MANGDRRHRQLRNELQELCLLAAVAVTAGAVAWLLTGLGGLIVVLVLGGLLAALRPRVPVALVLWMYDARPLPRWAAPELHRVLDVLVAVAGLPRRPALYYVASPVANAFVVGSTEAAALAVTDGLLRLLPARQLVAVLAHEVSHLRNGDTSIMALSDLVARFAQGVAWVGAWSVLVTVPIAVARVDLVPLLLSGLLVVVPTIVTLAQLALSRSREYDADVDAIALTRDPEGLAAALLALDSIEGRIWERILVGRAAPPDPLLLRTHPPTEDRVRRLEAVVVEPPLFDAAPPRIPVGLAPVSHRPRLRRAGVRW